MIELTIAACTFSCSYNQQQSVSKRFYKIMLTVRIILLLTLCLHLCRCLRYGKYFSITNIEDPGAATLVNFLDHVVYVDHEAHEIM